MKLKVQAQPYIKLQQEAELIDLESLPSDWQVVDNSFSADKSLFDYQVKALENAVKILWKYFEDLNQNKEEFAKIYEDLEIYDDLHVKLKESKHPDLLKEFFAIETDRNGEEYVPFSQISNSMSFWMATGSGKTIVIIKLIEILHKLMKTGLIPEKEILFLTYREDLLETFKKHVEEYNKNKRLQEQITIVDLKNYQKEKSQRPLGYRVFVYRSDLMSDERKETVLNFRDYLEIEDERTIGNWYLILDEAHKGDPQESKRQIIFSILSQKGFLFNFSATFTEPIDIVTTVYNLNLNEFINKGYGKQIYVSKQDLSAFQDKTDFSEDKKKDIVLKTLITLTAIKKAYENIKRIDKSLYHNPLLIFLVNSVNVEKSDLEVVFKVLSEVARGIGSERFNQVKQELVDEFNRNSKYTIGKQDINLSFVKEFISSVEIEDIYRYVFNSDGPGQIEYIFNKNNRQEIALKHKNASLPFALIRIGDISEWINQRLTDYQENESFEDKGYFDTLNDPDSPINLLLGSRTFYEGWDSNRPNVIAFVNIGKKTDAKKFVLQAIGRGVRIEPKKNKRQRIEYYKNEDECLKTIWERNKNETRILETLFVYATNKKAVETILTELELVKKSEGFEEVSLYKNERIENENLLLLVPQYSRKEARIIEEHNPPRFRMSKENLELLKLYFDLMPVERFILEYNTDYKTYLDLKTIISNPEKFIYTTEDRHYKDVALLIKKLIDYLKFEKEDYDKFVPVNDKIVHFRRIKVRIDKRNKFLEKVSQVKRATSSLVQKINTVKLRKLLQHFYVPIVYSKDKVEWLKHIIDVESEYFFIEELIKVLDEIDQKYDWWMFSKLDGHLDKDIYIPYYRDGKIQKFIPDFIFWLKKGHDYTIFFIDPKGTSHADYQLKIEGYEKVFTENVNPKTFQVEVNNLKLNIRVMLRLFDKEGTTDIPEKYRHYWINKEGLLEALVRPVE